jgi:hypothetical protein
VPGGWVRGVVAVVMTSPALPAVMEWCGFCGAGPDTPCMPDGQHLDRYLRAWREGLISRKAITNVCAMLGPVSAGTLVSEALGLAASRPA